MKPNKTKNIQNYTAQYHSQELVNLKCLKLHVNKFLTKVHFYKMFLVLKDWSPSWFPCRSPNAHPILSLVWVLLIMCSLRGRCVCLHIFRFVFPREILWLNSRHILHHFAINCWVFTNYSNILKQDKKYSVAVFSVYTTWCWEVKNSALTITCDKTEWQR